MTPTQPARTPISIARAIIIGALIVAIGTFAVNTLHDIYENHEQVGLRAHAADCRHWEEHARVIAYGQAELYREKLGFNTADQRVQPDYWVSLDKVQSWYPRSATDPSSGHVNRPRDC